MTAESDDKRFQQAARDYAVYLETPEGRLRADLAFANLQDFLSPPHAMKPMYVLDVGCGTGATAVRLARLGFNITGLDSSEAMLDLARRAAEEAGVAGRVTLQHGDAEKMTNLFPATSFDVVVCHNLLEYVRDPSAVLRAAAGVVRDTSAILSIVVRNQAGEVLKAAIQAGDLTAAENNLTAEWGFESLYGGRVRLFNSQGLETMLRAESWTLVAERGVRVLADYLPSCVSRNSEYARILELERKLGSLPKFAAVARYMHCVARRIPSRAKPVLDGDPGEKVA
jgi:S-adenosylmethionine-dependent methyltransferase